MGRNTDIDGASLEGIWPLPHGVSQACAFFLFSFYMFLIEVSLIYNVMLISPVQQSVSVIHIYTFLFIFFSVTVYHRILNIVPCALQQDLVVYPSHV